MVKKPLAKTLMLGEPTLEAFSFCKQLGKDSFAEWLDSLPVMDSSALVQQLCRAASELAEIKLNPAEHFFYLESIAPKIADCKPILEKAYLRRPGGDANTDIKALEIAQAMDGYLLLAYSRVLVAGISDKQAMALVVSRILETVFEIILRCCKLYLEVPRQTWSYLYQVHEFADKQRLLDEPLNLMFRSSLVSTSHHLFLQTLLLSCAGTMQLQSAQVSELVLALPTMAEKVKWGLLKNLPHAMFMVNVLDFRPPVYVNDHQHNSRYIKAIDIAELAAGLGQEQDNPYAGQLSMELRKHLNHLWSVRPVRQGGRKQLKSKIELIPSVHKNFGALLRGLTPIKFIDKYFPDHVLDSDRSLPTSQQIDYKIFRGELEDISEDNRGAKITIQGFPAGLCSGEVVSIFSDDTFHFGIVRWLRVTSRNSCQIGVRFISRDVQPCVLQALSKEGYWSDFSAAILSLTEIDGEPRPKLVCHRATFEKAVALRLYSRQRFSYVQLVGKEHITGSVLVATFRQIDPIELPKAKKS